MANGFIPAIVRRVGCSRMMDRLSSWDRLYRLGERNHQSRRTCPATLPRSRKKTLAAETKIAAATEKTYWTAAMTGIHRSIGLIRSANASMIAMRARSPQAKPTTPAVAEAIGRTIFGNPNFLLSGAHPHKTIEQTPHNARNHF